LRDQRRSSCGLHAIAQGCGCLRKIRMRCAALQAFASLLVEVRQKHRQMPFCFTQHHFAVCADRGQRDRHALDVTAKSRSRQKLLEPVLSVQHGLKIG
jgi:hypothetical protein